MRPNLNKEGTISSSDYEDSVLDNLSSECRKPSSYTKDIQQVEEVLIPIEKLTFPTCIRKIKDVFGDNYVALDFIMKIQTIERYLLQYFHDEELCDVFEGFLRTVINLQAFSLRFVGKEDFMLSKKILHVFQQFFDALSDQDRILIRSCKLDDDTFINALRIVSNFKVKHLPTIDKVFNLKDPSMVKHLEFLITELMSPNRNDTVKAITWMVYFKMRDRYSLEKIVAKLFVENQTGVLELFVGEELYRQKAFVGYLDKLIGYYMRDLRGNDENEMKLIADHKRLEKAVTKWLKHFKLSDSCARNAINLRCREGLLYHHIRWRKSETTKANMEELALHAMKSNEYVRDWYINLLCREKLHELAISLAFLLELKPSSYPQELKFYFHYSPQEAQFLERFVKNQLSKREKEVVEEQEECALDIKGDESSKTVKIITVSTAEAIQKLTEHLHEQEVVGIDAEWRPHFLTSAELIAILQVATSQAIFLIDVVTLEQNIGDSEWISFFEALFCTESLRKIGYDIRNDIRVLKNTFPFFEEITKKIKNVICLYRLFCQVVLMPEVSKVLFGSSPPTNMGLSDVSKFFLGLELDKTERVGNWSQRPLRNEQKKYAALDAYCLLGIFRIVSQKLVKINDNSKLEMLQKCSLIVWEEKKSAQNVMDGQFVTIQKEDDLMFMQKIQEHSRTVQTSSDKKVLGINDAKFAIDSMLYGLGRYLRKCGFDARLFGDRMELIQFCQTNNDFIALSTGKGYKQIATYVTTRALNLPVITAFSQPMSDLVKFVLTELNIVVKPDDLYSRCEDCNTASLVHIPRRIVEVLFHLFVIRHEMSWMDISDEETEATLRSFRSESYSPSETFTYSGASDKATELSPEQYIIYPDGEDIYCFSKYCTVDIFKRLLLSHSRASPILMKIGLKLKKTTFETPGVIFFVCADCGRVEISRIESN